ncbi:hypothetical protein BDQ17DRAFT_1380270 [Cyathus striatus]|nr:hypothetical protein BDQ17DRAFT_1380270 [Cyathus striatus]
MNPPIKYACLLCRVGLSTYTCTRHRMQPAGGAKQMLNSYQISLVRGGEEGRWISNHANFLSFVRQVGGYGTPQVDCTYGRGGRTRWENWIVGLGRLEIVKREGVFRQLYYLVRMVVVSFYSRGPLSLRLYFVYYVSFILSLVHTFSLPSSFPRVFLLSSFFSFSVHKPYIPPSSPLLLTYLRNAEAHDPM